jgi:hypothetical protein
MLCSSNRFVILLVIMKSMAVLRFALTAALLIASHGVAIEAPPPGALGAGAGAGLAEGLVGHWTFDGSLKDQVAGNDGVFTARRNAAPTYVEGFDGKQQGAIRFDGVDFVTIRRIVRDEMTIACWVRLDERQPGTATGDQFYMGAGLVQGEREGVTEDAGLAVVGDVAIWGSGRPDVSVKGTKSIITGKWTHVAAVRDINDARGVAELRLYVDGVLDARIDHGYTGPLAAHDTFAIGGHEEPDRILKGYMDDVRFYSRVLSEDEIRRLARSGGGSEVVAGERSVQTGDEQPVVNPRQSPGLLGDSNVVGARADVNKPELESPKVATLSTKGAKAPWGEAPAPRAPGGGGEPSALPGGFKSRLDPAGRIALSALLILIAGVIVYALVKMQGDVAPVVREAKPGDTLSVTVLGKDGAPVEGLKKRALNTQAPAEEGIVLGVVCEPDQSNQIRVVGVLEGSAAEKAGIRQGDIILEVEGTKVESVEALCDCVRNLKIHQKPEVVLVRVGGEGAAERLVIPLASAFTKKG